MERRPRRAPARFGPDLRAASAHLLSAGRAVVPAEPRSGQAAAPRRDRPQRRDPAHLQRGAGQSLRRAVRHRHPGRPPRRHRRGDRLQLPFRQGSPRHAGFPGGAGQPARLHRRRGAALSAARASAVSSGAIRDALPPAVSTRPPTCSAIPGSSPAQVVHRRQARPRARLSDREPAARTRLRAEVRHLRGARQRRRSAL